ncbi:metallophosphoesterase [Helicobacter kayseriensis]|uniref:metallophosphoesterase n=1 Tax=Helicobacter kayseriensis TaxID=2905877 RepID=UPI001E350835|nr:metallophosphoesterase [Helicobacter kayseriensis]MCE3047287.1 metallophosphoesterase [Helicobacter kayseriensis]MCE3048658.1 metallophosphoesterase [Helicobacter kayseriensis]
MSLKLNHDAIFIADSHFSCKSKGLLDYLTSLFASPPSQLILMGDIAQILLGNLKNSIQSNIELLANLDRLEKQGTQIVWLEGNHDLFLHKIKRSNLLKQTLFIPRKQQPIKAIYHDKIYLLAHGDLFLSKRYELYIQTLTRIPKLLEIIDYLSAGEIYSELEKKLECKMIKNYPLGFFDFASQRIALYQKYFQYPFHGIIEGHFHIGKKLTLYGIQYISLPAFYFKQEGNKIATFLK